MGWFIAFFISFGFEISFSCKIAITNLHMWLLLINRNLGNCVHESEIKLFLSSWIDVNIFKFFLLYHTNYALMRLKNAIPCNATDCLNDLVLLKLCWRYLSLYSWCKSFDQYLLFKIVKCKKLLTEILLVFTSCYSCGVSYINHNDFIVRACL